MTTVVKSDLSWYPKPMPTPDKHRLELVESVETLGGPLRASELSGTPRSTIVHWMRIGWPHYRQLEVDKLNKLAREADLLTLERLQRKLHRLPK